MSRFDQERFDPAPDPDLVCCICQAVLDGALETPCRHVFCKVCIETWLNSHQTCPTCRKHTRKEDLRPVLPIIQNMVNRLQMRCKNYDHGCINTVPLETIDSHEKNCGYEPLNCRFEKCGITVLRKDKQHHEEIHCEHREIQCTKDCQLLIPIQEFEGHNCLEALKSKVADQYKLSHNLQQRVDDLTSQRDRLEQQLGGVERKLEDALQQLRRMQDGSASDQLSEFNDDASIRTWNTEYTLDELDNRSVASNNTDVSFLGEGPASPDIPASSQDSARRSNASESTDNSPMVMLSSNSDGGVRVNVQGNASVSYMPHFHSSGSETSGFIAESSGYDQSPQHDLDQLFSESEDESNSGGSEPGSPTQERPASPEPPSSVNDPSDTDGDVDSIIRDSRSSPVRSHISYNTISDTDTADALRDILDATPADSSTADNTGSASDIDESSNSTTSPTSSTRERERERVRTEIFGSSSSDEVSDEATSDKEQRGDRKMQPIYTNDMFSDDDDGFVNNSPSTSRSGSCRSSPSCKESEERFYSDRSDVDQNETNRQSEVDGTSSDAEEQKDTVGDQSSDNESNFALSPITASNFQHPSDELEQYLPSPNPLDSSSERSRKHSEQSEQNDVESLLDHFENEACGDLSTKTSDHDDSCTSEEQMEKSLDQFAEEMEDIADEMDNRANKKATSSEVEDVNSRADNVKGNMSDNINNTGLQAGVWSESRNRKINVSSALNTSSCSIIEIDSVPASSSRIVPVRPEKAMSRREESSASVSDSQRRSASRTLTRGQTSKDTQLPTSSREQDKHIELLEEQYQLKRENKNYNVMRYLNHVQRVSSGEGGEVKREERSSSSESRQAVKRKYDQPAETSSQNTSLKKLRLEATDKSDRTSRSFLKTDMSAVNSATRSETVTTDSSVASRSLPVEGSSSGSRHRRSSSVAAAAPTSSVSFVNPSTSARKTGDRKHSWDPKNLNIKLNVAINLDKTARGRDQTASTSTTGPSSSSQQTAERPQRRSGQVAQKHRDSSGQERVNSDGNTYHQHRATRSEGASTSRCSSNHMKAERSTSSVHGRASASNRSQAKAKSAASSKCPPAATVTHPVHSSSRRPRRHAAPKRFAQDAKSDSSSDEDGNWEPLGIEPSDVSFSSSENEEENANYKLKIPIPTATLLEQYKDCDDSDDSWSPKK